MNIIQSVLILMIFFTRVVAQQTPVYDEYHLNKALINPAIIGSEGCLWIKGTDMQQWVGINDAPQTQTISIEASIQDKKAIRETDQRVQGLGGFIFHDSNGAYMTDGAQISYAYHFYLSKSQQIKIGLGLSFRLFMASLDESGFYSEGAPDPAVNGLVNRVVKPDAGAGIFMYNENFYAGISVAQLINASYSINGEGHYYFIAGYLTGNKKDVYRWLPSMAFITSENLSKQIDLNVKMIMEDNWWIGVGYRHNLDHLPGQPLLIMPMVGFNFGNFYAMYALDFNPGPIQVFNYGTHELMLAWHFCKDGHRCPVYR